MKEMPSLESVESISNHAFDGIKTLTSNVIIPDSVKAMDAGAFQNIKTTGNVIISSDLGQSTTVGAGLFKGAEIGGDLEIRCAAVPASMFKNVTLNGSLKLLDGLEEIGSESFRGLKVTDSTGLDLPSTLKIVGSQAFYDVPFTGPLALPAGLESIGASAFRNHKFIGDLTIPGSVKTVGEGAFLQVR